MSMKLLLSLLLSVHFLVSYDSFAGTCMDDPAYTRAVDLLNHNVRMEANRYKKVKRKKGCKPKKMHKPKCQRQLVEHQLNLKNLYYDFLKVPYHAQCSEEKQAVTGGSSENCEKQAQELATVTSMMQSQYNANRCDRSPNKPVCDSILQEFSSRRKEVFDKYPCSDNNSSAPGENPPWNNFTPSNPPSGFSYVGKQNQSITCTQDQNVVQFCRNIGKELDSCQTHSGENFAKCKTATDTTPEKCRDGSEALSFLQSQSLICQVSNTDYLKYKECLTPNTIQTRERLCIEGCASKPSGKYCGWTATQKSTYLGCTPHMTIEALNASCTDTTTDDGSHIVWTGASDIRDWSSRLGKAWPRSANSQVNWFKIQHGGFSALKFKTPSSGVYSGATSYFENTSVFAGGAVILSVAETAGDFNVSDSCSNKNNMRNKSIGYSLNLSGASGCRLKPNTTYYLNFRWSNSNGYPTSGYCHDKNSKIPCSQHLTVVCNDHCDG